MAHELLLVAGLHDDGDACDEVSGLLPHLGALVVEAPLDGPADLRQVRLHALAQAVHHRAKAVEHHVSVVARLQNRGGRESGLEDG